MVVNDIDIFNIDKTLVMSLIGISDLTKKKHTYTLIDKLNKQTKPPQFIADLSIHRLSKKETVWYKIIQETSSYATTLPVYYISNKKGVIDRNELLECSIEQMEEGVKIITIHPTPNKELYELSKPRLVPCTSRGGNIVLQDSINTNQQNAYLDILPKLIKYAKINNTIISIGASFRSANIFDSLDLVQQKEIELQLELANYIKQNGVSVIIETPGHASPKNILKIAKIFNKYDFPLMPLGPIITDTGIGMDHITASIGATLFGINSNVKIIAAVTSEEHTGNVPSDSSIIYALKTAQLTAHIIDMYKFNDYSEDYIISKNRAVNKTCIYEDSHEGCSRCDRLCPLTNKSW